MNAFCLICFTRHRRFFLKTELYLWQQVNSMFFWKYIMPFSDYKGMCAREVLQNMPRRLPTCSTSNLKKKGREKKKHGDHKSQWNWDCIQPFCTQECVSQFNESVSHFGFWRHDLISQLERRLINMTGLGATAAKREMGRRMNNHRWSAGAKLRESWSSKIKGGINSNFKYGPGSQLLIMMIHGPFFWKSSKTVICQLNNKDTSGGYKEQSNE